MTSSLSFTTGLAGLAIGAAVFAGPAVPAAVDGAENAGGTARIVSAIDKTPSPGTASLGEGAGGSGVTVAPAAFWTILCDLFGGQCS